MVLEHEGTNFERYFCIACRNVEPVYRISERGKEILRVLLDEPLNKTKPMEDKE